MKPKMYYWSIALSLVTFIACNSHNNTVMSMAETQRSLEVLDSKLNHLAYGLSSPEFKALAIVEDLNCLPFDYEYGFLRDKRKKGEEFQFDNYTGIYYLDKHFEQYSFASSTDNKITLIITLDSLTPIVAKLVIDDYKDTKLDAFKPYPLMTHQSVLINDTTKIRINYNSHIESGMPKEVEMTMLHDRSDFRLEMKRSKNGEKGKLKANFIAKSRGYKFLQAKVNSDIRYSRQGYYYDIVNFTTQIFDHEINGVIHYGKINPETKKYIRSFNENSSIEISENSLQLGMIELVSDNSTAELDLELRFKNGKTALLRNYLILWDKLYNYKIENY
ncbi:MAG: hypothetical protein KJO50_07270 [Bacteroidia bacterium]|nr:hypothetical protein [Bacteroidia bacterium]